MVFKGTLQQVFQTTFWAFFRAKIFEIFQVMMAVTKISYADLKMLIWERDKRHLKKYI